MMKNKRKHNNDIILRQRMIHKIVLLNNIQKGEQNEWKIMYEINSEDLMLTTKRLSPEEDYYYNRLKLITEFGKILGKNGIH